MSGEIRVAMFTGGRGASSITTSLLKNPAIRLANIVNAYDDGLSTGRLRALLPGYLGPSDFRKNVTTMMPTGGRAAALQALFEYRFPEEMAQDDIVRCLEAMVEGREIRVAGVERHWLELVVGKERRLRDALGRFLDAYRDKAAAGDVFDLRDASFGNLVMTGEYLLAGRSFNDMVARVSELCEIRGEVINVTEGDDRYLVGLKEDGTVLRTEATVVGPQSRVKIKDLYLLPEPLAEATAERLASLPLEQRERRLADMHRPVAAGRRCLEVLERADLIIYAPGTQSSSLLPSYLSAGVGEAIAGNQDARKIFVSNLREDHEIPEATADSLIETCVRYLNRRGELSFSVNDYVTDVFVHKDIGSVEREARYLSFNFNAPGYDELRIKASHWEEQHVPGLHNGDQIATQLHQLLPREKRGADFYYTVSIIVPAWNEERTIASVLRELTRLDLSHWNLSAEVVVVDGGSTDGTLERAREVAGVKVLELPSGSFGRGAAIKCGLRMTVSDLVVVFPADGEYDAGDVRRLLRPLLTGDCEVSFGARNLKPHSDKASLQKIYGSRLALYTTSLIGGRVLSLLTFLLYSRFISDPLTNARAFHGGKIRRLDWRADGFDHDQEVLGVLLRQDTTIFEIPVAYRPRTRAEGKKIRLADGLKALWMLVRTRFSRLPEPVADSASGPS